MVWVVVAALIFFLTACAPAADRNDSAEDEILEERAREYFDERFRFYPVEATAAGLHAYDGELGQFGARHVASRVLQLRDLRQRLLGTDLTGLSRAAFVDALWLTSTVKAELFELEEIELWRRSPRFYSEIVCRGVWSLLEPWGSPRVEALLSRLAQVPIVLQAAARSLNLDSPSPIAIEEGLADFQRCQATIAELPATLEGFLNDARAGEIQRATREVQEHIQGFIAHLETNVTPAEPDSFRWGEENLRVQLLYREMEETPLQTIRLMAERQLIDTKETTKKLAATLDASSASLTGSAEADEPAAAAYAAQQVMDPTEDLISATGELLEALRRLVSESEMAASVSEAPIPPVKVSRFVPSHAVALLETPGPLDPSGEAVFLLAPPSHPLPGHPTVPVVPYELQVLAMREVYPGKYFRFLAGRGQTGHSDLRRLLNLTRQPGRLVPLCRGGTPRRGICQRRSASAAGSAASHGPRTNEVGNGDSPACRRLEPFHRDTHVRQRGLSRSVGRGARSANGSSRSHPHERRLGEASNYEAASGFRRSGTRRGDFERVSPSVLVLWRAAASLGSVVAALGWGRPDVGRLDAEGTRIGV